jgi:acyl carrier protein
MSKTKLLNLFQEVLNLEVVPDPAELKYNEFAGWDSVAHMSLVAAMETEFDIMMDIDDIVGMSDFDEAMKLLEKYDVTES